MEAIIIDIQDHKTRTAQQVINSFSCSHTPDSVQYLLWEVFRGYAISKGKEPAGFAPTETEIAILFDDLLALVKAIETQNEQGRP